MNIFNKLAKKNGIIEHKIRENIIARIREKYSIDDELAILRQRDTKPEEFAEYNAYVEACKTEVKEELDNT